MVRNNAAGEKAYRLEGSTQELPYDDRKVAEQVRADDGSVPWQPWQQTTGPIIVTVFTSERPLRTGPVGGNHYSRIYRECLKALGVVHTSLRKVLVK